MTLYLYPRIDAHEAGRLMAKVMPLDIVEAAELSAALREEARVTFAAVGAPRVPPAHLEQLARRVRTIASENGYPSRRDQSNQQKFDIETAILLHEHMMAVPGEARRSETWQFLSAALLPDIVLWRWREGGDLASGDVSHARYLGGRRNCLGRLWLRADVFRDPALPDEWHYVRSLSEDNFTAILERGRTARYRSLCRAIAGQYLSRRHLVTKLNDSPEQRLLRQIMLRVTRASGYMALGVLDGGGAVSLVSRLADQTLASMGVTQRVEGRVAPGAILTGTPAPEAAATPGARAAGAPAPPTGRTVAGRRGDFLTMRVDDQIRAVWEAVLGEGALLVPDLVRIAAENLRRRGQVNYQRLREDGPLYRRIENVIAWAHRRDFFDAPSRGRRRAISRSASQIPSWLWQRLLRSVLAADQFLAVNEVTRGLQVVLHTQLGCNLTPKAILSVLRELQAEGLLLVDLVGQMRAAPKLVETDRWWPEANVAPGEANAS